MTEPTQEVARRDEAAAPTLAVSTAAQDSIRAWALAARDANALATSLVKTSFVPQTFQGKPADATVAILKGAALGLDPVASLEAIFVVHGKPALYARAMVGILQSQGHQIWTVEQSDTSVTVAGKRRGSDRTESSTWTIERAEKAGYTKANPKYASNPQEMLWAKAASEVSRHIAADSLLGLSYSVEDLELEGGAPTQTVQRRKPALRPVDGGDDDAA